MVANVIAGVGDWPGVFLQYMHDHIIEDPGSPSAVKGTAQLLKTNLIRIIGE